MRRSSIRRRKHPGHGVAMALRVGHEFGSYFRTDANPVFCPNGSLSQLFVLVRGPLWDVAEMQLVSKIEVE